ncbi:MAG: hypothetical protein SW019_25660, partial [Actinomycetota bacterium]|nr:hypothetical protein [Actinomycetota bacterium]
MARVHPEASISPTKAELARAWLSAATWFDGDAALVEAPFRFSYRFDDPAGKVGIESMLVRDRDRLIQVPLTYRESPLEGAEQALLTTMTHSVLGRRWVYDGIADPVLVAEFIRAIVEGRTSAGLEFTVDGEQHTRPTAVQARGTGMGDAVPADVEVAGVSVVGSTAHVATSLGQLRIPYVLDPQQQAGT